MPIRQNAVIWGRQRSFLAFFRGRTLIHGIEVFLAWMINPNEAMANRPYEAQTVIGSEK